MSRKDFELIARTFARELTIAREYTDSERIDVLTGFARLMASELAGTNGRFNRPRFLTACGLVGKEVF